MSVGLLLSGGMDSSALAYWKRPAFGYVINYGQAAAAGELRASKKIAEELGIELRAITADCSALGTGDMAGRPQSQHAPVSEWWPFRNQLIVTLAAMRALEDDVTELMVGAIKSDGAHLDGRPEFFSLLDALVRFQEGRIRISAPAIELTAVELVRQSGIGLNLLAWSHSCHTGEFACGQCRGCAKHSETMRELGYADY